MNLDRVKLHVSSKDPAKGYVYIVERFYNAKTQNASMRTLKSLGRLSEILSKPEGMAWAEKELERFKEEAQVNAPVERLGYATKQFRELPFLTMLRQLKIYAFLQRLSNNSKLPKYFSKSVCAMVLERCVDPVSKRATFENLQRSILDYSGVKLDHLYESLGLLAPRKDWVINELNKSVEPLIDRDFTLMIYDVSTFYFESFDEDDLRRRGMSKDRKTQETQVVLGLLIDKKGIPCTYELFQGDTPEVRTLLPILKKFVDTKGIDPKRVTVVADAGLNQAINIKQMQEWGFRYIVGFPPSSRLPKHYKDAVLSEEGWESMGHGTGDKYKELDVELKRKIIVDEHTQPYEIKGRLIVTFTEKRRRHDLDTIDKKVRLVEKRLAMGNASCITLDLVKLSDSTEKEEKRTFVINGKTLTEDDVIILADGEIIERETPVFIKPKRSKKKERFELNHACVLKRCQWAGYTGILTNVDPSEKSAQAIFEDLYQKWQIEDCFRLMKSGLESRPVYVRKPAHIRGHFLICYMVLFLTRVLEYQLRTAGVKLSLSSLRKAFSQFNVRRNLAHKDCIDFSVTEEDIKTVDDVLKALKLPLVGTQMKVGRIQPKLTPSWLRFKDLA